MADQSDRCAKLFDKLTSIPELFEMILLHLTIRGLVRCSRISNHWWATIHGSSRLRERLMLQPLNSERRGIELQQTSENEFLPKLVEGNGMTSTATPIVKLHHSLVASAMSLHQSIGTNLIVTIPRWQDIFFYPGSKQPWHRWNQAHICFPPVKDLEVNLFIGMTHFVSVSVHNDEGIRIWDISNALRPYHKRYRQQTSFTLPDPIETDDDDASDEEDDSANDAESDDDDVIVVREMKPQISRSTLLIGEGEAVVQFYLDDVLDVSSQLVQSAMRGGGELYEQRRWDGYRKKRPAQDDSKDGAA